MTTTPPIAFQHLSRAELDHQLSPSRSAKDFMGVLQRHELETSTLANDSTLRRLPDLVYGHVTARSLGHALGPLPHQTLDLTLPALSHGGLLPCLLFVHGGFWQQGSKAGSGFAARTLTQAGWAHAGVGYTLAPQAGLSDIVAEIGQAVLYLQREGPRLGLDPTRLVIAGHSAGAHLCAAVLAGMAGANAAQAAQAVAGAVLISGVYDLAPVAASYVNDVVQISPAEVRELSPLFAVPVRDVPVHILIGQDEPDAFQVQSQALRQAWAPHLTRLNFSSLPGRDHFDVLDALGMDVLNQLNSVNP
jgi:arylformamidase